MSARALDGVATAAAIRGELADRITRFTAARGRPPALGIVLAGTDPASQIYVSNKLRTAADAGCRAELFRLPEGAHLADALAVVARLNADDAVDGILVQSPLPAAMGRDAEQRVFDAVSPAKDVDGFHATNVGLLVQKRAQLVACTPSGVMQLLAREGIALAGKRAVVIGRSDIVGKPMALLLLHADATVTICHSRTPDVASLASAADILVAAVGRPGYVTPAFVKPGATVIDVGISRLEDASIVAAWYPPDHARRERFAKTGSLVVGDVHPDVWTVAGAVTPVPGGVGPLTIAMLLANTVTAAEARAGLAPAG
ncbi:MAG: bifunctional 5,10-methylenetetrahydrofolate dehydrogenase/5,10-methenyltetrahydrofolate cyclohydrolase [Acidobacteria bacterium]|jgi:methylenetetrahydrofolate dehydrogenase (NADP+)/methenyltetrahydrofolate cyclohydrolase|nr:bifunctional 5,10-methylenetetrahydrofolate dehydrogenase/5,10-methenyltetrahydrofolate cyclohydrolase [Acidobacteriota bacterium]